MSLKEKVVKIPLIKRIFSPYTKLRSNLYHQKRVIEAAQFDAFFQKAFSNVETGSLVVSVPEFEGSFEIDFRSHILRRLLKNKSYEPEVALLVKEYLDPSKDILDIGANIGLFTVLLAKNIGKKQRVLAVEPTSLAFHYLTNNCQRNKVEQKVILFNGFAADKKSSQPIHVIEGREEYSSLGNLVHPSIAGQKFRQEIVKGDTVDNLVRKHKLNPGLLKIDTEGAELLVLQGAQNTLRQHRPVIISELSDLLLGSQGFCSKDVVQFLSALDYRVLNSEKTDLISDLKIDQTILAIPMEK